MWSLNKGWKSATADVFKKKKKRLGAWVIYGFFEHLSVLFIHIIIKALTKRHFFFLFPDFQPMRNILPSSADQRVLSRTPGARSIIPGSHFHCPLLLTRQKNLGPIKGWRGHQAAKQAIFLHFTLALPSTAHFLFPAIISLLSFLPLYLPAVLSILNPTSHHCLVSSHHCMPFPPPKITALCFSLHVFLPIPHSRLYYVDKCHLVKKIQLTASVSVIVTQLCWKIKKASPVLEWLKHPSQRMR